MIYDLLVTTSVSAIALHRIRYELAERKGVALAIPFLITNSIIYRYSCVKRFGLVHMRGTGLQHLPLLALIGLYMFLAHFGQPMGAVLIVPKPAW
jgi:hypothetical protein